jgi:hypothetical protein
MTVVFLVKDPAVHPFLLKISLVQHRLPVLNGTFFFILFGIRLYFFLGIMFAKVATRLPIGTFRTEMLATNNAYAVRRGVWM